MFFATDCTRYRCPGTARNSVAENIRATEKRAHFLISLARLRLTFSGESTKYLGALQGMRAINQNLTSAPVSASLMVLATALVQVPDSISVSVADNCVSATELPTRLEPNMKSMPELTVFQVEAAPGSLL